MKFKTPLVLLLSFGILTTSILNLGTAQVKALFIPITKNAETATFSLMVGSVALDIKNSFHKDALADVLSVVIGLMGQVV